MLYLKKANVKIVRHKPIEESRSPINVIIESICSTNLGVDFCSTSCKQHKTSIDCKVLHLSYQ